MKKTILAVIVLLIALALIAGAHYLVKNKSESSATILVETLGISDSELMNKTYGSYQYQNGIYESEPADCTGVHGTCLHGAKTYSRIRKIVHVDLNRDGKQDAIVVFSNLTNRAFTYDEYLDMESKGYGSHSVSVLAVITDQDTKTGPFAGSVGYREILSKYGYWGNTFFSDAGLENGKFYLILKTTKRVGSIFNPTVIRVTFGIDNGGLLPESVKEAEKS